LPAHIYPLKNLLPPHGYDYEVKNFLMALDTSVKHFAELLCEETGQKSFHFIMSRLHNSLPRNGEHWRSLLPVSGKKLTSQRYETASSETLTIYQTLHGVKLEQYSS
jgi:hypothetical protein